MSRLRNSHFRLQGLKFIKNVVSFLVFCLIVQGVNSLSAESLTRKLPVLLLFLSLMVIRILRCSCSYYCSSSSSSSLSYVVVSSSYSTPSVCVCSTYSCACSSFLLFVCVFISFFVCCFLHCIFNVCSVSSSSYYYVFVIPSVRMFFLLWCACIVCFVLCWFFVLL